MRSLDDFLPVYEFFERHEVEIRAARERVDRALREVSIDEIRGIRVLYLLRGLGRGRHDTKRPFLGWRGSGPSSSRTNRARASSSAWPASSGGYAAG